MGRWLYNLALFNGSAEMNLIPSESPSLSLYAAQVDEWQKKDPDFAVTAVKIELFLNGSIDPSALEREMDSYLTGRCCRLYPEADKHQIPLVQKCFQKVNANFAARFIPYLNEGNSLDSFFSNFDEEIEKHRDSVENIIYGD